MDRREARAYAIRRGMEINGWKAPQLAARIKRDPNTVRRWLDAETEPRMDDVIAIAKALGIAAADLVTPPPIPDYPLDAALRRAALAGQQSGRQRVRDDKAPRKHR